MFVSLFSNQNPLERLQSALFVDAFGSPPREASRAWTGDTAVEDLMALARRIIGPERAYRAFRDYAEGEKRKIHELVADTMLISFVERQLAGSIGAASARVLVSRIAGGETISLDEVITILDETQQAIEYGRQLEQKSSELEAIAAQLREANARLKEIDTMKDDFLSRVSHELRTPMTSIRSFAEVLLDSDALPDEKRGRFVNIIYQESQRLTRLLDEILDLNRLESGEQILKLARLDPAVTAREALAAMLGFAHQGGIELEDGLPASLPDVLADADRLKQVLINLIHNAIKFNDRPGGRVERLRHDPRPLRSCSPSATAGPAFRSATAPRSSRSSRAAARAAREAALAWRSPSRSSTATAAESRSSRRPAAERCSRSSCRSRRPESAAEPVSAPASRVASLADQ